MLSAFWAKIAKIGSVILAIFGAILGVFIAGKNQQKKNQAVNDLKAVREKMESEKQAAANAAKIREEAAKHEEKINAADSAADFGELSNIKHNHEFGFPCQPGCPGYRKDVDD